MSSNSHSANSASLRFQTFRRRRGLVKQAVDAVRLPHRPAHAVFESLEHRRLLAGDFSTLGDELASKLSAVQSNMLSALHTGSKVPFLNEQLDNVAKVTLFPPTVLDSLKSALNGKNDEAQIEQAVFNVLGRTAGGADVLADRNGDGSFTVADVDAHSLNVANGTVTIDFKLGRTVADIALPFKFGLGLPGIPFNVASLGGMELDLEVTNSGVSFSYTDTDTTSPNVSINPGTVTVGADVSLADGTTIGGTFGFLQVTAKDNGGASHFSGDFTLSNLTGTPSVSLAGDALVNLHLNLGASPSWPSLGADLVVDWDFNTGSTAGSAPSVKLDNIGVELGSLLSDLIKPILEDMHVFFEAHQPVVDVLKARIPALSDGTNAIGLGDVSILSLVNLLRDIPGAVPPDWQQYIDLATMIVNVTDIINSINLGGEGVFIELGDLDLNATNSGVDFRGLSATLPAPDYSRIGEHGYNFNSLSTGNLTLSLDQIKQKLNDLGGSVPAQFKDKFNEVMDRLNSGVDYALPILESPSACAFKLLLGQDADLATFRAEFHLDPKFKETTPYKIFGYGIDFLGHLDVDGKFRAAYDTFGLRGFLADVSKPGRLLDGFYIDSTSFLSIGGEIKAQLAVELGPIAGVTVSGGIKTTEPVSIRIDDPNKDGKLRLASEADGNCVLKADGKLVAAFEARVHVGVTIPNPFGDDVFIGIDEELVSAEVELLEFGNPDGSPECLDVDPAGTPPPPPVLAGIVGDGQLQLYIGPNAHKRQNVGNATDGDENYIVTHVEGSAGDEKISVTAFGYTQTFEHVKSVWGDGGNGNDVVTLEAGVLAPATLFGGSGNDVLSHNGPGNAEIRGWTGNDTITGGDGNDSLYGEDGDDRLSAGGGNNHVEGNAGKDQIYAGDGNDSLFGGLDDDNINGGGGNDSIQGNEGNDFIQAGGGNDTVLGGDGNDVIFGGDGDDSLAGENHNDTLIGGLGSDVIAGNADNDATIGDVVSFDANGVGNIESGGDGDALFGGEGDDYILGQGGNDSIRGNAGDDVAFGQEGNDSMWGEEGDDTLGGDNGDDDIIGGDGADAILGGNGADVILGDNGTITPTGQTLPESTSMRRIAALASNTASDGNDTINGGAGADSIYGQGGDDLLAGSTGDDYIEGNQGNDTLSGGDDDDDLIGGSSAAGTPDGTDLIQGFGGHDVIAGDNAAITRIVDGNSYARYVTTGMQNNAVVRTVSLLDLDTIGDADDLQGGDGDDTMHGQLGDDQMQGGDGHDDMIGHLGADSISGGAGDDGIVGDKGTITGEVLDGSTQRTLSSQGGLVTAVINAAGTRRRLVILTDHASGSADLLLGGLGNDSVHGGAGADVIEGDDPALAGGGNDALFGNWGDDLINGGPGDDHLYGGSGNDSLNGGSGADTSYGGDGDDSLWADIEADRLIDWFGNFNNFYVPFSSYGVPTVIRSATASMQRFLIDLAAADGSWDPNTELVVVPPPSPDNAGPGGRTK